MNPFFPFFPRKLGAYPVIKRDRLLASKVAETVVKILEIAGIDTVYGIPGAGINGLYKYLGESKELETLPDIMSGGYPCWLERLCLNGCAVTEPSPPSDIHATHIAPRDRYGESSPTVVTTNLYFTLAHSRFSRITR